MKILAIDPSLVHAGWALLIDDGSPDGKLDQAGLIKPIGNTVTERVWSLYEQVLDLIEEMIGEHAKWKDAALSRKEIGHPARIVVEVPFTLARGGPKSRRSAMTLPNYGMAVGGVVCAAKASGWEVQSVPATAWSRGLPGVTGDEYKTRRVAYAAHLYNRKVEDFGARTVAGDVGDAVLLARWSMLWARAGRGVA